MIIALTFIGLPLVVRTLQPILADIEPEIEQFAASLGASRWQTFWRVILPMLWPALWTGLALSFARAAGEYGPVIFIAGNMPMRGMEITPLLIVTKLEQYDYAAGPKVDVELLTEWGQTAHVEVSHERFREVQPRVGQTLSVTTREMKIFTPAEKSLE